MKKLMFLLFTVFLVIAVSGLVLADYTPLPGVPSPEDVDFGGEKISIFEMADRLGFEEGGEREGRIEEAEELFNAEIVFEWPREDPRETVLAGEGSNYIYRYGIRDGVLSFMADELLYPVGDILPDEYFEALPELDRFASTEFTYNNKIYLFGVNHIDFGQTLGVRYNKTMLEREGLPDIWDLYEQGEWTFDKMEELAEAVTKDTTGDGAIDQWGLANHYLTPTSLLIANEAPFVRIDDDGRYEFQWDTPQAINTLNTLQEWYENGFFAPDDKTNENSEDVLMMIHFNAQDSGIPDDNVISIAPLPKGMDAERHYFPTWDIIRWEILATAENPEGLIAVVDYLFRPDDEYTNHEGTLYDWINERFRDEDAARFVTYSVENFQGEMSFYNAFNDTVVDVESITEDLFIEIIEEGASPSSSMEEIAPEIQSQLNELFDQ